MRRFSIPVWVAVLAMGPWDDLAATQTLWRGLVVAPESRCSPYDADDYRYPQSVEDRIIAELGGVYGPYTGRWFANKRETDIEHIVARSEAHDSGLCAADEATRRRFATDLLNLTLASPGVNRNQKRARDAAEWLPDRNRCWFADRSLAVRRKYGLTIDQREADALEGVLSGCQSTDLACWPTASHQSLRTSPRRPPMCMRCLFSGTTTTTAVSRVPTDTKLLIYGAISKGPSFGTGRGIHAFAAPSRISAIP